METQIDLERLKSNIAELATFGRTTQGGITRPAFSREYERARTWLQGKMQEAALKTRVDTAGNLIGKLGQGEEVIMVGSHLDSVPEGGPLDGALGVLTALECLQSIHDQSLRVTTPIEVVAFNDEEGAFLGLLGSRALTGTWEEEELEGLHDINGLSLSDAMKGCGLDIKRLRDAQRDTSKIKAYLELHIEGGTQLESSNIPIGLVTAIAGLTCCWMTFKGESEHPATIPMKNRKDAFLGAAEFALNANEWAMACHPSSCFNIGHARVLPGPFNAIPGEARLAVQFRGISREGLLEVEEELLQLGAEIADRRGLEFLSSRIYTDQPVSTSPEILSALVKTADSLGLSYKLMPSTTGHDAQVMALKVKTGMIFVPCLGGKHHCPQEDTRWEDVGKATKLLLATLLRLANAK